MIALRPRTDAWLLALALCAATSVPSRAQSGPVAVRAAALRIVPGDRVVLRIPGEMLTNDTLMVSERSDVALPMLGTIDVSRLTIGSFRDSVRAGYARYLKSPAVELAVLRRVVVNGEVTKPDVYYVDAATTLRDAIALAGGITPSGNSHKVTIIRGSERLPMRNWERDTTASSNLLSGDQVIVPRRNWLALNALPAASTVAVLASLAISLLR